MKVSNAFTLLSLGSSLLPVALAVDEPSPAGVLKAPLNIPSIAVREPPSTVKIPSILQPFSYETLGPQYRRPTRKPAHEPTEPNEPTNKPTRKPVEEPTKPTCKPAHEPTEPTNKPTRKPVDEPTEPTNKPTRKPVEPTKPTNKPTRKPVEPTEPTNKPTRKPVEEPTEPTNKPTRKPVEEPTEPTNKPTRKPVDEPTEPTNKPTRKPVEEPTEPTNKPTRKPVEPTEPTNKPTRKPVEEPTPQHPVFRNSHMSCFPAKTKRRYKFKAILNLIANEWQWRYSLYKCEVNWKETELCIPSTKKILGTVNGYYPDVLYEVKEQTLRNDFLCYQMVCPLNKESPDYVRIADQFGIKGIEFDRENERFKVCVPAWKLTFGKPIIIGSDVSVEPIIDDWVYTLNDAGN